MVDIITLALNLASTFASLVGLLLILRYRRLLRVRLVSNKVVFGFLFIDAILLIHCVLGVLNIEVMWLSDIIHILWSVSFAAAVVVFVHLSKLLRGYFSLSIPSFQSFAKRLSTMYSPSAAKAVLYASGKEAGYDDTVRLIKETGLKDEAFVRWLIGICESLGWGRYEIVSLKAGEELHLRVYDCFETTGLAKDLSVPITICFQSGYFTGVAKALRPNMECEAKETKCPLRGDPYCEFTVTVSEAPKEE